MRLIYTPKAGFAGPPIPWPATDHTEPDAKAAQEKLDSGFFAEVERKKGDRTEGGEGP